MTRCQACLHPEVSPTSAAPRRGRAWRWLVPGLLGTPLLVGLPLLLYGLHLLDHGEATWSCPACGVVRPRRRGPLELLGASGILLLAVTVATPFLGGGRRLVPCHAPSPSPPAAAGPPPPTAAPSDAPASDSSLPRPSPTPTPTPTPTPASTPAPPAALLRPLDLERLELGGCQRVRARLEPAAPPLDVAAAQAEAVSLAERIAREVPDARAVEVIVERLGTPRPLGAATLYRQLVGRRVGPLGWAEACTDPGPRGLVWETRMQRVEDGVPAGGR